MYVSFRDEQVWMRAPRQLHGKVFRVVSTASNGVVGSGTRLVISQRGERIVGRYRGGSIRRGILAGRWSRDRLRFRYLQYELSGELHGGESTCDIDTPKGRPIRIVEHFRWRTRVGGGSNVFEEIRDE